MPKPSKSAAGPTRAANSTTRDSDTVRVHALLGIIRELYAVEKQAKEFDDAARLAHRKRTPGRSWTR